ncbi:ATP-binding protein [Streptomyces sp. NPDC048603]|uniref:ATP-binding protein n=1 Tax=Streptomyces sp. NPDC048603 TaxID=3365577 RepID=UPI00370F93C2
MPTTDPWEHHNAEFLAASLTWLRTLLHQHVQPPPAVGAGELPAAAVWAGVPQGDGGAPCSSGVESLGEGGHTAPQPASAAPTPPDAPPRSPWRRRPPRQPQSDCGTPPVGAGAGVGASASAGVGAEALAAAQARLAAAEAATTPPPALVTLATRLNLTRFERDLLLMSLAEELDPSMGGLFAAAHGSPAMPFPTPGLALAVLPGPSWEAVSPHGRLRYWRLVRITRAPGSAVVNSPMRAEERIVDHVRGLDHLDERLAHLVTPLPRAPHPELPASQRAAVEQCTAAWDRAPAAPPVLHLVGAQPGSKRLVAACAAAAFGLPAYRLPAALLPARAEETEELARLWAREAALLPSALYLDADDDAQAGSGSGHAPGSEYGSGHASGHDPAAVARFIGRVDAPVIVSSREAAPGLGPDPDCGGTGRGTVVVDVGPPTPRERADAWREALGPAAEGVHVDLLARQFALDLPAIAEVAAAHEPGRLWDACLLRSRSRLDGLAQRLRPEAGWEDLVLPGPACDRLRQIADQVTRQGTVYDTWGFADRLTRGLGVTALFTGPSGTGKTMAAEVLARELGLDLYRTDLSAVMSKYIGETEKNLRRLFDAAEAGGAVLFLDEAEALLGKRSEVKDAHDRYANVQVDYLLQRLESHRGLAIMATNMRSALDAALVRRLRFVVEFPFPDADRRREIWRRAFPAAAPGRDRLDYDRLARLDVSGAMTRTIAVNAAFLAAAAGTAITMPLVLRAAREEFRKLEQPVRERDFLWTEPGTGPTSLPPQPQPQPPAEPPRPIPTGEVPS